MSFYEAFMFFELQRKLGIYLSPFLHGKRYTSFGRHFTKQEKLKEVNYFISFVFLTSV